MTTGKQLRDEGMRLAEDAAVEWWPLAWDALLRFAALGVDFTSEDIVELVGLPQRAGQNRNNAVGALFAQGARQGVIVKVGARNAKRPMLHAAEVKVWRGA